jgi:hypothetical protein
MKSKALIDAISGVTKKWTKQRKREERERSAVTNRHYAMTRYRMVSIREAAWRIMQAAFMQASANNTLHCYPTRGPKNRFGAILFLEKEGFGPLLEAVNLAARYDLAIMSTKGMSVTASRELVEELCATHDIPLLVLHDFDVAGFTIFGTLRSSTRRFRYCRQLKVIDLGLRLADIKGLEREKVYVSSPSKTADTLRRHGAIKQEIDILVGGERVELNALASNELVALIERKLAKHGIRKVIPDDDTLADAYQRMRKQAVIQEKIDDLIEELDESEVEVSANLRQRIEKAIKADPIQSWDSVMHELSTPNKDQA